MMPESQQVFKAEIMHLARTAIAYFDMPWEYMNDQQLDARRNFLYWIDWKGNVFEPTEETNAEKLISEFEMQSLWKWINELLFGGDHSDGNFKWRKGREGILGQAKASPLRKWKIWMNPEKIAVDFDSYKMLAIISTLFHEAIHAFLGRHGCRSCKTWKENQMAAWHGRAWQLVAAKVEDVVPRLLGIPVYLGRFVGFISQWDNVSAMPSRHDMLAYRFSNMRTWSEEDSDIKSLIASTSAYLDIRPRLMIDSVTTQGQPWMTGKVYDFIPERIHTRTKGWTCKLNFVCGNLVHGESDEEDEEKSGHSSDDEDEIFWDAEDGEVAEEVSSHDIQVKLTSKQERPEKQVESSTRYEEREEQPLNTTEDQRSGEQVEDWPNRKMGANSVS